MLDKMTQAAKVLAYLYRGLKKWKAREAKMAEAYKATRAYRAYQKVAGARKGLQALIRGAESDARNLVLENYAVTKDKHPAPGLGVRESKGKPRLVYTDPDEALRWLRENAPGALMPDNNVVQAMVEAGKEIPGVHVVQEGAGALTATITGATKLIDLYLKED